MNTDDRARSTAPPKPISDPDATDEYNTGVIAKAAEDGDQAPLPLDYIDEAIEESIPVSDPPATTPTTGIGAPAHRVDHPGA